jgi:hypothetical protein
MALSTTDITFTFSGGSTNTNPDLSLGGDPSVQPIVGKRLFDDVEESETKAGLVDYRCIYLHNESFTDTLYTSQILVAYTVPGEVTVQLGFDLENERQNLTVTNATLLTGGSMTLTYSDVSNQYDIIVQFNASLSVWATNLQTQLRTIPHLQDVEVSGSLSGSSAVFEIDFVGAAASRYHEAIVLKTGGNNLLPGATATISVVKSVNGSPINRVADEIDVDTTTPNNIAFTSLSSLIGDIRPLDAIPIWMKRIVPANTAAITNDGFTLRIAGSAIAP